MGDTAPKESQRMGDAAPRPRAQTLATHAHEVRDHRGTIRAETEVSTHQRHASLCHSLEEGDLQVKRKTRRGPHRDLGENQRRSPHHAPNLRRQLAAHGRRPPTEGVQPWVRHATRRPKGQLDGQGVRRPGGRTTEAFDEGHRVTPSPPCNLDPVCALCTPRNQHGEH